jgi:hypothetical protein
VLVAIVAKCEIQARAVLGGGPDEIRHNLEDVEWELSHRLRRHVGVRAREF